MTEYRILDRLPAEIFRAYDIRGEVSSASLTPDLSYVIGLALGSEAQDKKRREIIVGRDNRLSGPDLQRALMQGLLESGCNVIEIGIVPTPLVYFATQWLTTDSGIMITASHNPKNHNGFKIVLCGQTLSTEGVQSIYQRIKEKKFYYGTRACAKQVNIIDDYINYITTHIRVAKKMHVVIDCGNGAASQIAPRLYRALGCEVSELFCVLDGNFPNHHPDPTVPENLATLIDTVKTSGADVGLAFDGDADRLGVVTNQGKIIWPDRQMMLYAKDVLSHVPGADIVFDVKCTSLLPKMIRAQGGNPIMYRTGHSVLKKKMIEIGAPLAGEMSGHVFFKEGWFGFDDGIYVGARLLQILAQDKRNTSEIFNDLPNSVNTPELKLPMPEDKKAAFMQRLISEGDFPTAERITIDGLRVEFDYGWGLVRPSNTSPNLILRFEANSEKNLERIKTIFRRELLKLDKNLHLPF